MGGVLVYDRELQAQYAVKQEWFLGLASLGGIMDFSFEYPDATEKLFDNLFTEDYNRAPGRSLKYGKGG